MATNTRILIIDDEENIRMSLKEILDDEGIYETKVAEDGMTALNLLHKENFDIIFSDIKMPMMDGIELLEKIKASGIDSQVIMISGHGDIETAVECIKKGAYDFLEKPFDLNRLLLTIRNAADKNRQDGEIKRLKTKVEQKHIMIGDSIAIQKIRQLITRVAPTDSSVLITGENGTGKEIVARQIHMYSKRNEERFVEVNCAAIPADLIESELFGHVKGAFTSADGDYKGKFELADGGTIFLDEIGDMSMAAQAKVLRCLQEHEITPIGSENSIHINVRVIAATNKELMKEIDRGNFREDLYHRLNVIPINVPCLEDHADDIPLLIDYFNRTICKEQGKPIMQFTENAITALCQHHWRGNIRELRNVVERLIILCDNEVSANDVETFA